MDPKSPLVRRAKQSLKGQTIRVYVCFRGCINLMTCDFQAPQYRHERAGIAPQNASVVDIQD